MLTEKDTDTPIVQWQEITSFAWNFYPENMN